MEIEVWNIDITIADNHQLQRTDIFLTGIHQVATHARHKHVIANKGQSHFNRNFQRSFTH